jgi:hypothetical protein
MHCHSRAAVLAMLARERGQAQSNWGLRSWLDECEFVFGSGQFTGPPGIDGLPVPAVPVKVSTGQFLTKPDDSLLVGGTTVIACFLGYD